MNYADLDAFHAALGEGHISAKTIAQRLAKELRGGEAEEQLPTTARQPRRPNRTNSIGVHVEGLDDVMVRLSRCCTPVPGDEIMGFVTQGRGRERAPQRLRQRRRPVGHRRRAGSSTSSGTGSRRAASWPPSRSRPWTAPASASTSGRSSRDHHLNILRSESHTGADRVSRMRFEFELADPAHLESLLNSIKRLDSVYDVYRILPGKGGG